MADTQATGEIADLIDGLAADAAGASSPPDGDLEAENVQKVERARTVAETVDVADEGGTEGDDGEGNEEGTTGKPDAPKAPPGFANVTPITDKLVTDFTITDTDGDEVEPPALVIEYKANGKVRKDRLDQVVKLAQFGVYNQERETALVTMQDEAQRQVDEAFDTLRQREAQMRRVLEDEEVYLKARERYLQENSPERRAERAEAETRTVQEQRMAEQAALEGERFFESDVLPAIDEIATAFPEVEIEEISAQFTMHLMPLMKNGVVPRSKYAQVRQFLDSELREWASTKHEARAAKIAAAKAPVAKEAEAAKVAAAKAKRDSAQATRPSARSGTSAPSARKPVGKMSVDEASDDALASVLSSITY
jgi:hypothetical protein